jgi:hypothetical protein
VSWQQLYVDGNAVDHLVIRRDAEVMLLVERDGGAWDVVRLFEPAPEPMPGQLTLTDDVDG